MAGEIEVDETSVGQKEVGKVGRSKGSKKLVVVAIKRDGKGISKAYAKHIDNAGGKELKPFFEDHIDKEANIRTDGWRSYASIKKTYKKLTQEKSENGKNFNQMHRFIMGLKAWLRGIHGSVRDLQKYLDEYCYKFNRNKSGGNIFNLLLIRMANFPPRTSKQIFSVS
jgi:transposase-like protein